MRAPVSSQTGFSLAEMLVALFILAAVSAAGSGMLVGATSSGKQIREQEAEMRALDIAQAMLRNDIAAMSARAVRQEGGYSPPGNLFGRSAPSPEPVLSFVRDGWINPEGFEARSNLQLVTYRLEGGHLIRRVTTRPDAVQGTPIAERTLLSGVTRVETRFRRGEQWSEQWIGDAGQPLSFLPSLIELSIVFDDQTELQIAAMTGGRP